MKSFRTLLVATALALAAVAPHSANATQLLNGRSRAFTATSAAGWEEIANGTATATTGNTQLLNNGLQGAYTALRLSAYCTYTGAVSGRYVFFITETDPAGNVTQAMNVTGSDAAVDTGGVLAGAASTPVILEVGANLYDASAAGATRTYARRGYLPGPYFGLGLTVIGTFATSSCRWYLHGFRG